MLWCGIFFLRFLYCVADKQYLQLICNSICNAIIVYLSVCYFDFVADGRCFFIFQTFKV